MYRSGMWKWLGWCLCLTMVLLASCSPAPVATSEVFAPVVAEESATEEVAEGTYYFLAGNNADPFYVPGVKGMNDAGEAVGHKVAFVGPMDLNLAAQMKTFEELCASPETLGVLYYPMDFNAAEEHIKECEGKGIPVVIGAADSPFKTRSAFIGVSDQVFGTQAGMWAEELTKCQGKVGTIALVQANTDARIAAFTEYLKTACPDLVHAERVTHDGSVASATAALDAYLIANPDMTLIYFADGSGGQQAQNWKEKQEAGLKTMFLATDSPPLTLNAVKEGIFVGTVAQDTYIEEYWGIILLDALHRGLGVPDTLYLPVNKISQSNVDQFITK